MEIREIILKNFGKYNGQNPPMVFKSGINVVYGRNEAGKSTLFNGLLTLLYGFKPANRDTHPYLAWGEDKIELSGTFEDSEGLFSVERKLMSSPSGYLVRNDKELKINNKVLDHVQDISKESFESIYALTLKDIVKMQDKHWSEVEDRLILNYGIDTIKSPREVLTDIEEEMKALFNPRGQAKNTKVRQIENNIKSLKLQRREIIETQTIVLEKEGRLKTLESELETLLKEEIALEKTLIWWEKHQSVIDLCKQLEGVKEQVDQLARKLGSVPDAIMSYDEVQQKIKHLQETQKKMQTSLDEVEAKLQVLTENEKICVTHHKQLEDLLKAYQAFEGEMALHIQGKEFVDEKKRQLDQLVSDIIPQVSSHQAVSLATFSMMTLEGQIENITTLIKDTENLQREIYAAAQQPVERNNLMAIGLIAVGAGLFGLGLYLNQPAVNYLAVVVLSFGGFKVFNTKNKNFEEDITLFDKKIKYNKNKIEEETLKVQQKLAFLKPSKETIQENGQGLLLLLKSAKELAQDFLKKEESYKNKSIALLAKEEAMKEELLGLEFEEGVETLEELEIILDKGIKINQKNEHINIDYRNKQGQLKVLANELEPLEKQLREYQTYLNDIGQGDTSEGLNILNRFLKLKEKVRFLEEQLIAKDPGGVMQNNIKQYEQNSLKEQNTGEIKIQLREVREKLEGMKLEKRSLITDLDHLLKGVDLFDIESQLLALEDELEKTKETYDQLLLLKTIVSSYDQEYRELHQPDIHKRTGAYFNQITKGKYPKIYADESIDKTSLVFRQEGEDKEAEGNLSQGARDQLYLALRLALADELDKDKSTLPIFLDELFVNWDMLRLEEGIELLKRLSTERQIILFTCHEWMVDKVKELASPHIIMLES